MADLPGAYSFVRMGTQQRGPQRPEETYSVGVVARLSGLSPEVLRAWERRYRVVEPLRTEGGTRRYRPEDLERVRLVKRAVDAGHRVGRIARLPADALRRLAGAAGQRRELAPLLGALSDLADAEVRRLLALQLATLGPGRFARELVLPLVDEVGERWSRGRMGIASEHLLTGVLRSLLGAALQPGAAALLGPRLVLATPPGEPHELGLLVAALIALGAGANPLYLGPDLPVPELVGAARRTRAAVVGLSLVTVDPRSAGASLAALRRGLEPGVAVWLGGRGAAAVAPPAGVERIESLEALEQRVLLLAAARTRPEPRRCR